MLQSIFIIYQIPINCIGILRNGKIFILLADTANEVDVLKPCNVSVIFLKCVFSLKVEWKVKSKIQRSNISCLFKKLFLLTFISVILKRQTLGNISSFTVANFRCDVNSPFIVYVNVIIYRKLYIIFIVANLSQTHKFVSR